MCKGDSIAKDGDDDVAYLQLHFLGTMEKGFHQYTVTRGVEAQLNPVFLLILYVKVGRWITSLSEKK